MAAVRIGSKSVEWEGFYSLGRVDTPDHTFQPSAIGYHEEIGQVLVGMGNNGLMILDSSTGKEVYRSVDSFDGRRVIGVQARVPTGFSEDPSWYLITTSVELIEPVSGLIELGAFSHSVKQGKQLDMWVDPNTAPRVIANSGDVLLVMGEVYLLIGKMPFRPRSAVGMGDTRSAILVRYDKSDFNNVIWRYVWDCGHLPSDWSGPGDDGLGEFFVSSAFTQVAEAPHYILAYELSCVK